ncbi:MAG: MazG family protein [Streptosporangiaceae bacterium]
MSLILLATTHRVAPGLLTWRAWSSLRSARVLVGSADHPMLPYLREAGVTPEVVEPSARFILDAARAGDVLWLAAPDGDVTLMEAIGALVVADPVDVEVQHGSYDLPGARLLDLVSVLDTLRRECPWDAEQTHESLVPYLLEETYEAVEAIAEGDHDGLREELGDVLMQIVFHSVLASEREDGFSIDDVAAGIVDKLIRRHPHVFADVRVQDAAEVEDNWERIKKAERAGRSEDPSVFDGVPMAQPALMLAAQLQRRARRAGAPAELFTDLGPLFAAAAQGDAETELRAAARSFRERVQAWERTTGA